MPNSPSNGINNSYWLPLDRVSSVWMVNKSYSVFDSVRSTAIFFSQIPDCPSWLIVMASVLIFKFFACKVMFLVFSTTFTCFQGNDKKKQQLHKQ